MKVSYFYNTDNKKLYRLLDGKKMQMWYKTKSIWGECSTTVKDLSINEYQNQFQLVCENNLGKFM